MAWSGGTFTRTNGVYSGSTVWAQDKAQSVKITAARHDTHDEDLADGIDACLTKDGSNAATADLDLGGFKYTNAASGTARAHLATLGQTQDSAAQWAGTSGGSANAYTLTLTPAITDYAAGQTFRFVANHTNTGAATVAVNGLAAKNIKLIDGSTDPSASEIVSGNVYEITYDGTAFRLSARILGTFAILDKTANYTVAAGDVGALVRCDGTFTLAFDPIATLGADYTAYIANVGSGNVTLDPDGSEQIDGLTSFVMYPGEVRQILCDGTTLTSVLLKGGSVTYTSSGTFTVPPGVSWLVAEPIAAGGGGGSGGNGSSGTPGAGGGSGGGGMRILHTFRTIPAGGTAITVTIGAGGTGGAAAVQADGTDGGNTSFGAYVTAYGGKKGIGSSGASGGSNGAGGQHPTISIISIPAGTGTQGADANGDAESGGGGGGGGLSLWGGQGGASGVDGTSGPPGGDGADGADGAAVGDGGQGGRGGSGYSGNVGSGGAGGDGADGQVTVWWG